MNDLPRSAAGGAPVPLPTAYDPAVGFEAKRIVHVILTLDEAEVSGDQKSLRFLLADPVDPVPDPKKESIEAYAQRMAKPRVAYNIQNGRSPYDIMVRKQSWVLVELDPRLTNWQFTKGEFGCTTKGDYGRDNFGLRHVYADRVGEVGAAVEEDGCRFLFFGIARRDRGDEATPASQYFNFHVEFLQAFKGETAVRRMKVIFDPDVGNNGGFPIPP